MDVFPNKLSIVVKGVLRLHTDAYYASEKSINENHDLVVVAKWTKLKIKQSASMKSANVVASVVVFPCR